MQDRPTAPELAEAVREFLKAEVLPSVENPRLKFRTLVAVNALGILGRELDLEEAILRSERGRLVGLLGAEPENPCSLGGLKDQVASMNRELTELIRAGAPPPGTFEALQKTATEKLAVASPRYLERYANGL